jgi:hypothetical protein
VKSVPAHVLRGLADLYQTTPVQKFRRATCACCERPMIRMHHCWLTDDKYLKEIHLCKRCWGYYAE